MLPCRVFFFVFFFWELLGKPGGRKRQICNEVSHSNHLVLFYLISFCLILSPLILSSLLSSEFYLSCLICYLSTLSFSLTLLQGLLTSSPLFYLICFIIYAYTYVVSLFSKHFPPFNTGCDVVSHHVTSWHPSTYKKTNKQHPSRTT